jgi:hypothetical protein
MTPEHVEPPSTIKEVGIHIGYMREDISELKKLLETMPGAFATKDDLAGLTARVIILEKRNGAKNTLLWVGLVASAIINIVVIYQLFTGSK